MIEVKEILPPDRGTSGRWLSVKEEPAPFTRSFAGAGRPDFHRQLNPAPKVDISVAGDCIRFSVFVSTEVSADDLCKLDDAVTPQSRLPVRAFAEVQTALDQKLDQVRKHGSIVGRLVLPLTGLSGAGRPVIVGLVQLAQQAFQRDFHHHLVVAGGCDQQAFVHYPIDQNGRLCVKLNGLSAFTIRVASRTSSRVREPGPTVQHPPPPRRHRRRPVERRAVRPRWRPPCRCRDRRAPRHRAPAADGRRGTHRPAGSPTGIGVPAMADQAACNAPTTHPFRRGSPWAVTPPLHPCCDAHLPRTIGGQPLHPAAHVEPPAVSTACRIARHQIMQASAASGSAWVSSLIAQAASTVASSSSR